MNRLGSLINLIGNSSYTFPSDGYLYLEASYRENCYVQLKLYGSGGTNSNYVMCQVTSPHDGAAGNSAMSVFVKKGMIISGITTNNTSYNKLQFSPLSN